MWMAIQEVEMNPPNPTTYIARLVKLTPAQRMASGTPTPSVDLVVGESIDSIAFDESGSLYVLVDQGISRFSSDQLVASGSPSPQARATDVRLSGRLAFDAAGGLWGTGGYTRTLLRWAPGAFDSAPGAPSTVLEAPAEVQAIAFRPTPP
jgi:hypothetical protein